MGIWNKGKTYDELFGIEKAIIIKEKNRAAHLGKKQSKLTKLKNRLAHLGKKNSKEHNIKIGLSKSGSNHPCWVDREIRFCSCGCGLTFNCKKNSDRKYVWQHHPTRNPRIPLETRKCACGCGQTFECKETSKKNFIKGHVSIGKKHSKEAKKKMRMSRIRNLKKNGNHWPSYNPKACEFFKSFDQQNNTKGRYAVYGDNEYEISELGYFPDYINFDLKLIMEYDEPRHYNKDKSLKQKDILRQEEIQAHFPDFKFERIKEAF